MHYLVRSLVFLTFFFFASCVHHDDLGKIGAGEDYALKLQVASGANKTYASVEDQTLQDACFVIFDAEDELESLQVFEQCPSEVVFSTLRKGEKKLYVIANYAGKRFSLDTVALHRIKKLADLQSLGMSFNAEQAEDSVVPMTYSETISIPVTAPSLPVNMRRILSRVLIDDDIAGFKAEWVRFDQLTDEFYPWAVPETAAPSQSNGCDTIRFVGSARNAVLHMLPAEAGQIKYDIFGKSDAAVSKVYSGAIRPKIGTNKSFTMSLSSGELSDDGAPSDISVSLSAEAGNYDEARGIYSLRFHRGNFILKVRSYDEVEIETPSWMQAKQIATRSSREELQFEISFDEHRPLAFRPEGSGPAPVRTVSLNVYNKNDRSLVQTVDFEQQPAKYYVVMIAGQSNASGWDASPYDPLHDAPSDRVFGLGQSGITVPPFSANMYSEAKSTLDIVPLYYRSQGSIDLNGVPFKSVHLPLGKELLKHLPSDDLDYDILMISNSAPATGFVNVIDVGTYNRITMRPGGWPNMRSRYLIAARQGAFYFTMLDRIKYTLGLNDENKFLGVVWFGGETDTHTESGGPNPYLSYDLFKTFTENFFEDFNAAVPAEKMVHGQPFGPDMWFNVDHSPHYRDWHGSNDVTHIRSHYYGGYKDWNPSTFIRLPEDVPVNGSIDAYIHFGNNGFRTHITPLIVKAMSANGLLGEPSTASTLFVRQISASEIQDQCGTPEDADIQQGLLVNLPLNDPDTLTLNLSQESVHRRTITNNGLTIEPVDGLIGADKGPRPAQALHLMPAEDLSLRITSATSEVPTGWSISFMLRRNNAEDNLNDETLLMIPSTKSGLFYHRYQLESEARHLTLAFQPWGGGGYNRTSSVVARLIDASYVRRSSEWIHYTYTYDNTTRICRVYMNGEKTMEKKLPEKSIVSDLGDLVLGGTDAHISHLCVWDREIDEKTAFKVYLQGYFGANKSETNSTKRR